MKIFAIAFIILPLCLIPGFHSPEAEPSFTSKDSILSAFPILEPNYEHDGKDFYHFYTDCNSDIEKRSKRVPSNVAAFLKVDSNMTYLYGRFSIDKNYEALITETIIGYCGTYVELYVYDKKKRKLNAGRPLMLATIQPAGDWWYSKDPFTPGAQDAYIGKVFNGDGLFCVIVSKQWNCIPPLTEDGELNCEEKEHDAEIFQWVARPGEFPSFLSLLSPGFDKSGFPVESDPGL